MELTFLKNIWNRVEGPLKTSLFRIEKYAPHIASRAWGVIESPLAEIQGFKLTKLTQNMAQLTVKLPLGTSLAGHKILAAELVLKNLWARHLGPQDRLVIGECHYELMSFEPQHHFVARTELLENDRERILRESR